MSVSRSTESIEVVASIARITTMADGGIRASFDLPEDAVQVAAWLMECKQHGRAIAMAMVGVEPDGEQVRQWTETRTG